MKKIYFIAAICLAFFISLSLDADAQRYRKKTDQQAENNYDEPATTDSSKWRNFVKKLTFGGGLGASFGQVTFIDISPMVGYRATDALTVGVGGTYNYLSWKRYDPYGNIYKTQFNLYGGRLFTQYVFFKGLFGHAEFEALNVPDQRTFSSDDRTWMTAPLIGGGYRSPIGPRSFINITALYHTKFVENSQIFPIYPSPLILRIGFSL